MVPMAAEVREAGRWHPDLLDGEWTVELLETLPDDGLRYELIDGALVVSPAPSPLHQVVAANVFRLLDGAAPPDRAVLFAPVAWRPDGRTSLEPDLLVIAKDRIATEGILGAPDVVVEILSPSSGRFDRTVKLSRYADGGAAHYWIVDPAVPSVEIYDLREGVYLLVVDGTHDDTVSVTAPFTVSVTPSRLVRI
jgi:Uma2 family endonuclease